MAQLTVHRICPLCKGTGTYTIIDGQGGSTVVNCTWQGCEGGHITLGYVEVGVTLEDLDDKLDDLKDKIDDLGS